MLSTDFVAKTEFISRRNKTVDGVWPVGIDYGFSAIKCFAPNKVFCFPNCALKLTPEKKAFQYSENDILFKRKVQDDSGEKEEVWIIGEKAHELMSDSDAMNFENEMYDRNRYNTQSFKALMLTGLGIAVLNNSCGQYQGEPIVVQTGLPPRYMKQDSSELKDALEGSYEFSINIGGKGYKHISLTIYRENIIIMPQPMGSLYSVITKNDGTRAENDTRLFSSQDTLILDPGFKTVDTFHIVSGYNESSQTFDNLGMYEIYSRISREIEEKHHTYISISRLPKVLRRGQFMVTNQKAHTRTAVDVSEMLERHSKDVCKETIAKLDETYNYLQDIQNLVITGGTGSAWFGQIRETYKDFGELDVLAANRYDETLPNTYSNVRGYYLSLISRLAKKAKKR